VKSPIFDNRMMAPPSPRFAGVSHDIDSEPHGRYWEGEKALYYVVKQ